MPMTISIDEDLKRDFTEVCKEIGLPPSTAIGIFAKAVVRERAIPFELSAISSQQRMALAYDLAVVEGVNRGLHDFQEGDFLTREESRAQRASRTVVA